MDIAESREKLAQTFANAIESVTRDQASESGVVTKHVFRSVVDADEDGVEDWEPVSGNARAAEIVRERGLLAAAYGDGDVLACVDERGLFVGPNGFQVQEDLDEFKRQNNIS